MQLLGNEETGNNEFKPRFPLVLAWRREDGEAGGSTTTTGKEDRANPEREERRGLFHAVGQRAALQL